MFALSEIRRRNLTHPGETKKKKCIEMLKGNRGVKQQQAGQVTNNNSKREKNNSRQDKNKIKYGEGEVNEDRSQTKRAKVQTTESSCGKKGARVMVNLAAPLPINIIY